MTRKIDVRVVAYRSNRNVVEAFQEALERESNILLTLAGFPQFENLTGIPEIELIGSAGDLAGEICNSDTFEPFKPLEKPLEVKPMSPELLETSFKEEPPTAEELAMMRPGLLEIFFEKDPPTETERAMMCQEQCGCRNVGMSKGRNRTFRGRGRIKI